MDMTNFQIEITYCVLRYHTGCMTVSSLFTKVAIIHKLETINRTRQKNTTKRTSEYIIVASEFYIRFYMKKATTATAMTV